MKHPRHSRRSARDRCLRDGNQPLLGKACVALGSKLLEQLRHVRQFHIMELGKVGLGFAKQPPTDLLDLLRRQVERGELAHRLAEASLPVGSPAQPGSRACLGQIAVAEKGPIMVDGGLDSAGEERVPFRLELGRNAFAQRRWASVEAFRQIIHLGDHALDDHARRRLGGSRRIKRRLGRAQRRRRFAPTFDRLLDLGVGSLAERLPLGRPIDLPSEHLVQVAQVRPAPL